MKKNLQVVPAKYLGQFLKECREAQGLTQEELATQLAYSKQIISDIERGKRDIPLDRQRIERYASALNLKNSKEFLLKLLEAKIPHDLLDLLRIDKDIRGQLQKLDESEVELIWLKRCHDKLRIQDENGNNGKTKNYRKWLEGLKDRLKELSDDEVSSIEQQTTCFKLIVPDLTYELPEYAGPYVQMIKKAYGRKARYEYLLPATRHVLNQFKQYLDIYNKEIEHNPELFSCKFIIPDDWLALVGQSGHYSGRCLYELQDGDSIAIEYDRKRSAKNYLMTLVETSKFKDEFLNTWRAERTLKNVAALQKYVDVSERIVEVAMK